MIIITTQLMVCNITYAGTYVTGMVCNLIYTARHSQVVVYEVAV